MQTRILLILRGVLSVAFILVFLWAGATGPGLEFIPNQRQWNSGSLYVVKIPGGELSVGALGFQVVLRDQQHLDEKHLKSHGTLPDNGEQTFLKLHRVDISFLGANASAAFQPFGKSAHYYNYFLGNDPSRWASNVSAYDGFIRESFYPGIDLKVYSSDKNLKYDFLVSPGADPTTIVWQYDGGDHMTLDNGNLIVSTSLGQLIEKRPIAYQIIDGVKKEVPTEFVLAGNRLSFHFPEGYDACYPMTIDPLLIFSTYSGSTADNWGSTATPGEHGRLYSAGVTNQSTFNDGGKYPVTTGAFQTAYGGVYDIGILKYDSTGSQLLYASFLGGSRNESPHSLIMDANEDLVLLGTTESSNFPTSATAIDRTFNGGVLVGHVVQYDFGSDIVVARISRDGSTLIGSTFLGGSQNDGINSDESGLVTNYGDQLRGDVITDKQGNIIISSVTRSTNFPVSDGFDLTYNGGLSDAVIVKMTPTVSQIIWSTFLGGASADAAYSIKFDSKDNLFLAGGTASSNFPTTTGAYHGSNAGDIDGWIANLSADGKNLIASTLTGTSKYDQIYFIDLNSRDDVYAYGQTDNPSFPVSQGVYANPKSGQFIQKFNPSLTSLGFSTVIGSGRGIPDISPTAFLINDCDNIYLSGWGGIVNSAEGFWQSNTAGMPISNDAVQKTTSGSDFYFMVLTDDAQSFLYGTYLGGVSSRTHVDGGTSRFDKGGVVYHAVCSGCAAFNATNKPTSDFPTTPNAWSRTNKSKNCNNAAFKFDLSSLKANIQTNNTRLTAPGLSRVCIPDSIVFQNLSIGGEIFKWDLGDGTKETKTNHEEIIHQYKSPGVYLVKMKALDAGTCREVDSTATYVTVNKSASYVQPNDQVCEGNSYALKAYGGVFYEWKSSDGFELSKNSTFVVSPLKSSSYSVLITERNGCRRMDTVKLNVIDAIHPDFDFVRQTNCFERPTLKVKNVTDSIMADDHVFFDFGDGQTTDASDAQHIYDKDGIYHVTLVGARSGCVFEKSEDLVFYKITVPNVITPGKADGKNDRFIIQFGEQPGSTPADFGFSTSLKVLNRWGEPVFENENYQSNWSAENLASGVYFYEVKIDNHDTCRSWVHVIK
jgi:hypothetical protein